MLLNIFKYPKIKKIFQGSPTARYIYALILVAILIISWAILSQFALVYKKRDQSNLIKLHKQLQLSRTLRMRLLDIQLSTTISSKALDYKRLKETKRQFSKNHQSFLQSLFRIENLKYQALKTQTIYQRLNKALPQVTHSQVKHRSLPSKVIKKSLSLEQTYFLQIKKIIQNYKKTTEAWIYFLQWGGILLLIISLLLLAFIGLFILRPSVKRLNDALKTRSDFLGQMSHEIRNPMNAILGMTHALKNTHLNTLQYQHLFRLEHAANNLLNFLNNVLDLSKNEGSHMQIHLETTYLVNVIENATDPLIYQAHEKGIEMNILIESSLPQRFECDQMRLQQILTNLIGNAVKFTKEGDVTLEVYPVDTLNKPHSKKIFFCVKDTGVGISNAHIKHIFETHSQGKNHIQNSGSGLGLMISKQLVHLLGGELKVTSKQEKGSEFYFTLPLNQVSKQSITEYIPHKEVGNYDFIIITPHSFTRKSIEWTLSPLDFSINHFEKINTFLEQKEKKSYLKTIWFIDFSYLENKETLIKFLKFIKAHHIPFEHIFILIKTITPSEDIQFLQQHHLYNILIKPVLPTTLTDSLRRTILSESSESTSKEEQVSFSEWVAQNPLHILFTDDSPDNRFLAQMYLKDPNIDLDLVENGKQALHHFNHFQYDIIFLDLQMGDMDGYQTVSEMRKAQKKFSVSYAPPIIAITAYIDELSKNTIYRAGFNSFIKKPFYGLTLKRMIHSMVSQTMPLTQFTSEPTKEHIQRIYEYLEQGSFEKIEEISRQMKGHASAFGLQELKELAQTLETAVKNQSLKEMKRTLKKMHHCLTKKENQSYQIQEY